MTGAGVGELVSRTDLLLATSQYDQVEVATLTWPLWTA